jgi:hypothetical protein
MIVMMIAMTPSLNAASLSFSIELDHFEFVRERLCSLQSFPWEIFSLRGKVAIAITLLSFLRG